MKTTVEIADVLLVEAKQQASRDRTTLRALIEEGLREILRKRKRASQFSLRDASFRGHGLRPEIREGDWETLRALAYEGRGE
jgi:hypothetical protein